MSRKYLLKALGPRPSCPECKGSWITSHGSTWLCRGCGRRFNKVYRKPPSTTEEIIPSTEVIDLT